ncbi:MAG: GNAT family N-acetyltransferase [Candidatus Anstonellales archaeon]
MALIMGNIRTEEKSNFNFLSILSKIGSEEEFHIFKNLYAKLPKEKFAVIKISGECFEKEFENIIDDIAFMYSLDLVPIIVHGAQKQLDSRLKNSKKIEGIRFTHKNDMKVIKETYYQFGKKIENSLLGKGVKAKYISNIPNIIVCDFENKEKYGYVGKIVKINKNTITQELRNKSVVILSPIGNLSKNCNDCFVNINADYVASKIAMELKVKKLIYVTSIGGILDKDNNLVNYLNLRDLTRNKNIKISNGMIPKIKSIKEFLIKNRASSVSVTSAQNLLKEIFSVKGSGTYIKYFYIKHANSFSQIDIEKLKNLLIDAFSGRKLVSYYFSLKDVVKIYYEKDYYGCAILRKPFKDFKNFYYLDKLAVSKAFRGTGLGNELFQKVIKNHKYLIWRSNKKNDINNYYFSHCTGCIKTRKWNIFWINIENKKAFKLAKRVDKLERTIL